MKRFLNLFTKNEAFTDEEIRLLESKGFEILSASNAKKTPLYQIGSEHEAIDGIKKFNNHYLAYSKVSILMGSIYSQEFRKKMSDGKKTKTLEEALAFFNL